MTLEQPLITLLNDGRFHTGPALAAALGVSRAAVWKMIRSLQAQGLTIEAVKGRGYRLTTPLELLDPVQIRAGLAAAAGLRLAQIEVFRTIDSTNTYLVNRAKAGVAGGSVCLAERQTAGRGRRNRLWVSPFAANLYLSLLWRFNLAAAELAGLSLAAGVAVARALEELGVTGIGLKWPNDVLWQGRKLGGILLELGGEASGPCHIVTGIGLNVTMPASAQDAIDQPWTDLSTALGAGPVSRNVLAARLLNALVVQYSDFERHGAATLSAHWQRYDLTAGRPVLLKLPNATVTGIARGVDSDGALLLDTGAGVQRFLAGEVSLRLSG